jgi:predicted TIM-barrel fold metal-dependent hydrolase
MIIDVHTHIFESAAAFPQVWLDEEYRFKKDVMGAAAFEGWKTAFNESGRVETLIVDMDEAGINKSVVLPLDWGIVCRQEAKLSIWRTNEYAAEAQRKYPDRIIGFVGVDPLRGKEAIELLEKGVKEWGLKGVKIISSTFKVTDPSVQAFMSKINELGVPTLFHMGSDPSPFAIHNGNPADLDTLSLWYPKMKMIAAHCARGYQELLTEILCFKGGTMYAEISGLQYELMKSPWHFKLQMRYLMDKVPRSVLMGTDWPFIKTPPMPTHKEWFDAIRKLKIPEQVLQLGLDIRDFSQNERDMILGGNAKSLLGLE